MAVYTFNYAAYTDTWVRKSDTTDRSQFVWASVGNYVDAIDRYLFHCDISSVSGTVLSAYLAVKFYYVALGSHALIVHRTAETDWTALANWPTKDGTNPWTTLLGGDPVVVPGQSPADIPLNPVPFWYNLDVTEAVKDAIANRSSILGLLLALKDETGDVRARFYQGRAVEDYPSPLLTITTATTYTLTLSVGANGSATVAGDGVVDNLDDTYTCPADGTVFITATPDSGFQIDSVTGDVTLQPDGSYAVTMTSDKTVTLVFIAYWTLTLTSGGNGQTTVSPDNHPSFGTYRDGEVVTLTPTADAHYGFDSWSGADSGDVSDIGGGDYQITMAADKTIQADFAIDTFTLTINTGANGDESVLVNGESDEGHGDGTWTLNYGDLVRITARGDVGFYLSSGTGAPLDFELFLYATRCWYTGDGNETFPITSDLTVNLTFTAKPSVTLITAGGANGTARLNDETGDWGDTGDFIPASAGGPNGYHLLHVLPDIGYQVQVTGDMATPYYSSQATGGGYYYRTSTPDVALEITVTWVAIAAGQATPRAWARPWNDKPWGL